MHIHVHFIHVYVNFHLSTHHNAIKPNIIASFTIKHPLPLGCIHYNGEAFTLQLWRIAYNGGSIHVYLTIVKHRLHWSIPYNREAYRVREICQSCQTWPAKFGQILPRTDTRLVFCHRKLMSTDIIFTRATKPISCNFANPEHNLQLWSIAYNGDAYPTFVKHHLQWSIPYNRESLRPFQ